jgi:hypothetical protein
MMHIEITSDVQEFKNICSYMYLKYVNLVTDSMQCSTVANLPQ